MSIVNQDQLVDIENYCLASYAAKSSKSRGRIFDEPLHPFRTEFQRDRERIIHCRAFRRLEYKTQVFLNHEGDHYRTRLTHSIEVSQIARTIAKALRLNEDLAESIALAHDLGHTPFGHAGERELNELLKNEGGFEHNKQSLRIVEKLEKRYNDFDGINLTWETREGIIKHSSAKNNPLVIPYLPNEKPSLEAQIIDIADEIAYNNHDLDDGLASGILKLSDVENLEIWKLASTKFKNLKFSNEKIKIRETIKQIINIFVSDLITNIDKNIQDKNIIKYSEIKQLPQNIACFTQNIFEMTKELKIFLRSKLYNHYKVARMSIKAQMVIKELFSIYTKHPDTLPENFFKRIEGDGLNLTVADYIAGMTDRFALEEHKKLTDPSIRV